MFPGRINYRRKDLHPEVATDQDKERRDKDSTPLASPSLFLARECIHSAAAAAAASLTDTGTWFLCFFHVD